MWEFLFIYSIAIRIICGQLIGDHICFVNESYTVNLTEPYMRNITIRKYEWCMNIPPRCSQYSTKEINDTKIVEKTYTNTIQKCCPGFYENNNTCLPHCGKCENGLCNVDICVCLPGFVGENCDSKCDPGSWGPNCTKKCNCDGEICNPFTGNCSGEAEILKTSDKMNIETTENASTTKNTNPIIKLDIFGTNYNNTSIPNISKEPSVDHETKNNEIESSKITNISVLKDMPVLPPFIKIQNLSTNIPSSIQDKSLFSAIGIHEVMKTSPKTYTEWNKDNNKDDFLINEHREFLIPVKIKYDEIARPLTKHDITITTDSDLFNDADSNRALLPEEKNVVNGVSISTATTTVIIILAVIIISVHHIRRNKRKNKDKMEAQTNTGISTVSVYTTSIFHTPLPDPPTYKNPYLARTEYNNSTNELKSFGTPIVCNMNKLSTFNSDCKDYIYDHPPSTGSYRAASRIDPLDVPTMATIIHTEPVYDEIPCRSREQVEDTSYYSQPKSLYMNTGCSK